MHNNDIIAQPWRSDRRSITLMPKADTPLDLLQRDLAHLLVLVRRIRGVINLRLCRNQFLLNRPSHTGILRRVEVARRRFLGERTPYLAGARHPLTG